MKPQKPAEQAPAERPEGQQSDDAEFDRFEDLTRKLLEVSKRELDEKRNLAGDAQARKDPDMSPRRDT